MVTFAIVWCLSRRFEHLGGHRHVRTTCGGYNVSRATAHSPACTFFAILRYTLAAPVTAGEVRGGVPCPPRPL